MLWIILMALDFWWLGFKKELEGYGTGDLGRVIAAMNAKVRVPAGCFGVYLVSEVSRVFAQALVAGGMLLRRAKAESDRMLDFSAERLRLVVEN
jgi:hypothetical protein